MSESQRDKLYDFARVKSKNLSNKTESVPKCSLLDLPEKYSQHEKSGIKRFVVTSRPSPKVTLKSVGQIEQESVGKPVADKSDDDIRSRFHEELQQRRRKQSEMIQ